jgi:hypothetical protein
MPMLSDLDQLLAEADKVSSKNGVPAKGKSVMLSA